MTHQWERLLQRTIVALAVFAALNCTKAEDPPDTGVARDSTLPTASGAATSPASEEQEEEENEVEGIARTGTRCDTTSVRGLHTLNKPLRQMSDLELCKYLNLHRYSKAQGDVRREGRRCTGCTGSTTTTYIQPVIRADTLKLPGKVYGQVVARIINEGSQREEKYGIPAGGKAWLLVENVDGVARFKVFMRRKGQTPADTVLKEGEFIPCTHGGSHTRARADWRKCSDGPRPVTPDSVPPDKGPDDPAWLTCNSGCCVARTIPADGP